MQSKIEQNTHLRKKAIELRQILKDRNAQLQCDTQIRESQRYIDYFTEELRRLQTKGSRASFISIQPSIQQQLSSESLTESTTVGVMQQPIVDSPSQISQSYFPATTNSTCSTEEEESKKRYTNLGKAK